MIDPIWTAALIGLSFVGMRLFQRSGRAPRWLAAVTPAVPLGWTVAGAVIGIAIVAALVASGALRASTAPILVIAVLVVLQVAVLLSVVVFLRRQGRTSH